MDKDRLEVGKGIVQEISNACYVVVPVIYRRKVGLKKGDRIRMFYEGGDELILKPARDDVEGGREEI